MGRAARAVPAREALKASIAALHERLESDEGLDAWLLELGEERVTAAADRLGWIEDGDVAS